MQTEHQPLTGETNPSIIKPYKPETAAPEAGCGRQAQPTPGGGDPDARVLQEEPAPRRVIRGESFEDNLYPGETFEIIATGHDGKAKLVFIPQAKPDGEPLAALTDYLNTTFPFDPSQENIVQLVHDFRSFLGEAFGSFEQRKGGLHGYKTSFDIGKTDGLFAFGGQRGTALVSLPGSACALIEDWPACYQLFHEVLKGRITRWDGAVDVFDGVPSVDDAVHFYKTGQFNAGGNKPSCSQQGNWIEADGSGRTFYVGKRKNGKLLRIYEKGKQLGDSSSPWVRWELELHNRDRMIPWEVLLEPGKYLAAAYGCMGWVSEKQERIRTTQQTATLNYQHLTHYARQAYGPLINVMLEVEGSPEKVLELLKRPGFPSRLELGGESLAPLVTGHDDQLAD
ncbi:MAG: replication initiation factor domain-containing protein [Gammaproteobacteria bacterium]